VHDKEFVWKIARDGVAAAIACTSEWSGVCLSRFVLLIVVIWLPCFLNFTCMVIFAGIRAYELRLFSCPPGLIMLNTCSPASAAASSPTPEPSHSRESSGSCTGGAGDKGRGFGFQSHASQSPDIPYASAFSRPGDFKHPLPHHSNILFPITRFVLEFDINFSESACIR
jgi:hypothetical protein